MVNYRCNAACRHCLYACSPSRHSGYITQEKTEYICDLLVKGRIGSVHIGGGEPFLDFEGLLTVIRCLVKAGIQLDYIETNAFWASKGPHDPVTSERINILKNEGVEALCISIDPFHAEYIPWAYPIDLAQICEKQGMGYFLWKEECLKALSRLDRNKRHAKKEIEAALGGDYIARTAAAYGIRLGGRAVNIEEEYGSYKSAADLLDGSPCFALLSTGHFHVDMDGYFIPPGCTGLRLPLDEVLAGTKNGNYPVFESLFTGGIAALWDLAAAQGFSADKKGYPSKCNLCFHIRKFLAAKGYAELDEDFYAEALRYW